MSMLSPYELADTHRRDVKTEEATANNLTTALIKQPSRDAAKVTYGDGRDKIDVASDVHGDSFSWRVRL